MQLTPCVTKSFVQRTWGILSRLPSVQSVERAEHWKSAVQYQLSYDARNNESWRVLSRLTWMDLEQVAAPSHSQLRIFDDRRISIYADEMPGKCYCCV